MTAKYTMTPSDKNFEEKWRKIHSVFDDIFYSNISIAHYNESIYSSEFHKIIDSISICCRYYKLTGDKSLLLLVEKEMDELISEYKL